MDKATLVTKDINAGKNLVNFLEKKGIEIAAALWYYSEESEVWRLMIATPLYDNLGPKEIYEKIQSILNEAGVSPRISIIDVTIVSPKDEIIRDIRSAVKIRSNEGVRFSRSVLGRSYIYDALIYRSGSS